MSGEQPKQTWMDVGRAAGTVHVPLVEYCKQLEARYWSPRIPQWELYLRMFGDDGTLSLLPSRYRPAVDPASRPKYLQMNITRSLCDTGAAKIGQARPRPYYLTDAGDWGLQEKATALQRLTDGVFDQVDLYEIGQRAQLDSVIFGTGCFKIWREGGEIKAERVLISEILVDEALCYYSSPRELFRRMEVPRRSLEALYPTQKARFKDSDSVKSVTPGGPDLVVVYEGWHLPDGPDAPGRHVVCVSNATLVDEKYERNYYPIIFIHWQKPILGFYGSGIPAQVFPQQVEINRTLIAISRAHKAHGVARMLVPNGSKVNPLHIDDEMNRVLQYDGGQLPTIMAQQILSPEIYQHLQDQYKKAYELTGLSSLSAFAQKPAGIDSGKGLRELADTQADRLAPKSQDYDRMYLQSAKVIVDLCREIHKKKLDFQISTVDEGELHTVSFKEVADLQPHQYKLQLFASNFLGRTPSAKIEDANRLIETKILKPQQVARLIDAPDVKSAISETLTAEDTYRKQVRKLLKGGKFVEPEAFDALDIGMPIYRDAYLRARESGAPETILQKFRDWLEKADELVAEAMPPPSAPPQAQAAAPTEAMQAAA